jgi:hypothetical protein
VISTSGHHARGFSGRADAVGLRDPRTDSSASEKDWDRKLKIRLVGVGLSGLGYAPLQEHLFQKESREKKTRLYEAADKIRGKFGVDSIGSARTVT